MNIGAFTYDPDSGSYSGSINTITLRRAGVTIEPSGSGNRREPDFRVLVTGDGGAFEIGAAWKKRSERGADYLSVLLDDPAFPARLDAALFTDFEEQTARLVWSRLRPAPKPDAKPQADRPPARGARRRSAQPQPAG